MDMWPPTIGEILTIIGLIAAGIIGYAMVKRDVKELKGEVFHDDRGNRALESRMKGHASVADTKWENALREIREMREAFQDLTRRIDSLMDANK